MGSNPLSVFTKDKKLSLDKIPATKDLKIPKQIKEAFTVQELPPESIYLWNYILKEFDTTNLKNIETIHEVFSLLEKHYMWSSGIIEQGEQKETFRITETENNSILVDTDIWLTFMFQSKEINKKMVKNNVIIKLPDEDKAINNTIHHMILAFTNCYKEVHHLPIDLIDSNLKVAKNKELLKPEWFKNETSKVEKNIDKLSKKKKALKAVNGNPNNDSEKQSEIEKNTTIRTILNRKLCKSETTYRTLSEQKRKLKELSNIGNMSQEMIAVKARSQLDEQLMIQAITPIFEDILIDIDIMSSINSLDEIGKKFQITQDELETIIYRDREITTKNYVKDKAKRLMNMFKKYGRKITKYLSVKRKNRKMP